ncbi:hypothetical protein [Propylenella binzhouense]|uniref:Uncharacterized protein n=1 Tax=Propylenella binzhouense TaxID=2555902 RepID=A0A964T4E6_9HYPH|nr:hypothetical protein [Propylenella binzhouense]MYZ47322.1 hypothetical protein [Propylenella binzhouense]
MPIAANDRPLSDDDFLVAIAAERRQDWTVARAFAEACAAGDVELMHRAVDALDSTTIDGWRFAMRAVARLPIVSDEIRAAFLPVWIEHKMLPLKVGHRPTMAAALRMLLPSNHSGGPIHIFRGTRAQERRRRLYGFSWSSRIDVARGFAEHWAELAGGAVVLEALAHSSAILLVREEEGYYDEGEIVIDPFRLGSVTVAERLPNPGSPHTGRDAPG